MQKRVVDLFKIHFYWIEILVWGNIFQSFANTTVKWKHLEKPTNFNDDPLHGAQVEEHRDAEVEEVDDGEHFEHEHW